MSLSSPFDLASGGFVAAPPLLAFVLIRPFKLRKCHVGWSLVYKKWGTVRPLCPGIPPGIYSASVPNSKYSTNLDILSLTLLTFKFLQSVKTYPSFGDFAFSQGP